MVLKSIYDKLEDVPEKFRELFTERNGKFELTGVEGVKTQADIDRLSTALTSERDEHKKTKGLFEPWSKLGKKPEEIATSLDRLAELELMTDKTKDTNIDEIVEKRMQARTAPLTREVEGLKSELAKRDDIIKGFEGESRTRKIHDAIRTGAKSAGLLDAAIDDAILHGERIFTLTDDGKVAAKEGVGVTPGLDPSLWLSDLKTSRPHWFGATGGSGAKGGGVGGGENPWAAATWNLTEQGKIFKADRAKAESLAKAAGTSVGGPRPAVKKAA